MSIQHTSKSSIVISRILGTISSVIGYAMGVVFGLPFIFGEFKDMSSIIVALIFIVIASALIAHGIRSKKRIKRFKKYISIISTENQSSLENIASACSQSVDFVTKDLQKMISKKFFTNAYIDKSINEIILQKKNSTTSNDVVKKDETVEHRAIVCKGCGASNSVVKGKISECEFCGSTIAVQ